MKELRSVVLMPLVLSLAVAGCQKKIVHDDDSVATIPLPSASASTAAPTDPTTAAAPAVDAAPAATTPATPAPTVASTPTAPKPSTSTPKPSGSTSTPKPAEPKPFSIAQCCAALHGKANSAPVEQQMVYSMAASSCDAMPPEPSSLAQLRAMTASAGVPNACS